MAATPNTPMAVTEKTVGTYLESVAGNLANYAVRKYDPQSFIKSAMLCIMESKQLMEAMATEAGKRSLYHALRFAASTGLSLNPQEGKAALVPKGGKINYWIMANGWKEIITSNPRVDRIVGLVVYKNDKFEISQTLDGDNYLYKPALDDKGSVRGFCSAIRTKEGMTSVHYMTNAQMLEHRDKYAQFKGPDSAWSTSYEGRGLAACMKMHCRRLSLGSPELDKAIDAAESEAEPAQWEEVPGVSDKGTSAADVEHKLAVSSAAQQPPAAESQPAATSSESTPAGAPGAQGSAAPAGAAPAHQGEIF